MVWASKLSVPLGDASSLVCHMYVVLLKEDGGISRSRFFTLGVAVAICSRLGLEGRQVERVVDEIH